MDVYRRRLIIGGAAALYGARRREALVGNAALVRPYSPTREAALFPRPVPFFARYSRDQHRLGFVAAEHGNGRENGTFALIERALADVRPNILIVEGFPTSWGANAPAIMRKVGRRVRPDADSYESGEDVFAASLAVDASLPFLGGDVADSDLFEALLREGFQPDDIAFSAMFGPLLQDLRAKVFTRPEGAAFEASYRKWANAIFPAFSRSPPREPAAFTSWFARHYGKSPSEDEHWADHGGPGEPEIAGRIGNATNLIRDRHLLTTITTNLNRYDRLVVVYGGSHLSSLWDALHQILGAPIINGLP